MKNIKGYIHSILTGATLDGPGVRYVIFLQMCPFRCLYCHNPDSWQKNEQNVKTVDDLYCDILKYKDFFDYSCGGVTLSGGEPLLQADFALSLFKKLKTKNIHTCLDTCGYCNLNSVQRELLNYCDLVMLDIKHLDPDKHLELTGKDNKKVFEFLDYLYKNGIKTRIRQVLVPTFTTDEEYIKKLADFLQKYKPILEKVELLEYHKMGVEKWEKLGYDYKLNVPLPDKNTVDKIKNTFIKFGYDII